MFKKLYIALMLGSALACKAAPPKFVKVPGSNDIQPDEQQAVVCKWVTTLISGYNYKKVPLNDSISTLIFNKYIKTLDENHNYLLASDIADFEKYKTVLDDDLKGGNLNDAFYIFNVYQKRYNERVKYSLTQIDKNFDFNKNETFTYDREKLPWAASVTEMDALWTQRVKYDLLNLKLASNDMAANRVKLKKRYEDLLANSNKLNNQDVFQIFMDAFTETIDPHTNYFNPANAANFNIDMSRSLEGIGATLQSENDYVTVKTIVAGGPADKSHQIEVGDRIVGVAQGKDGEFSDVIGWRIENAIALIRGNKGTIVRLKILPKGKSATDKPKMLELMREKIILKDQSAQKEIRTYNNNGKQVKIGIISVPAFYVDFNAYKAGDQNYKSTTRDVRLILDTLKKAGVDGIVMDLRQNGGGSLMEAIELTGLFIKTGPVVQVRDTRDKIEVDEDEDPSVAWSGPLAVMVDRFSASASEIFSGAIQDYGRGLIVGSQTYGKGTVQNAIDLDKAIPPAVKDMIASLVKKATGGKDVKITKGGVANGGESAFGQLNLTIAKFYRISGGSTQHKGVTPDVKFPSVIPMDKYGEDTEPSALPYDMVPKSNYTKVGDFTTVLPQLTKLHDQRMANNPSYKYLLEDLAEFKKRDAEKSTTLNEAALKQEREADEQKTFERNNLKRVAVGLPSLKKGETAKAADRLMPSSKNKTDLDFLKVEAGQILTDYISLDNKYSTVVKP
ncbi:carboxy terminal-processing peptidase [Mucilaginibacter mali]|uniref:Carboxy terminal-processing peptidase n=1 Tax=Mucilaginibacter mali TaxID=2740462 RepID=A0A7D4TRE1_9SPHI|nr:carboxy terminal-processing peptidase [Mucilaginibacter mali]QKJ31994.1 carboxy terminal-processing peptidase [Mucilaginibacter mali]